MLRPFHLWSLLLIVSLTVMGLSMRYLAVMDVPYYESLYSRGVVCLVVTLAFAWKNKYSLIPKSPSVQLMRALIAGLALTLITKSYSWLSASAVSVLSNVDVPLLIILGPLIGQSVSWKPRILSFLAILLLVFYVLGLEMGTNTFLGLLTLGLGLILLCFGYYFIKKSMTDENAAITIAVPSIAIIIYGIIQSDLSLPDAKIWSSQILITSVITGVGMFYAYYSTMKLYAEVSIAKAEFPGLFSALVIQPIEFFLFDTPLEMTYFLSSVFFVFIIHYIMLLGDKAQEVEYA